LSRRRLGARAASPGVVAEGTVGLRAAGRLRLFRYEIRCWRDGVIPDVAEAVESTERVSEDADRARRLLDLVPQVPTPVRGRDDLGMGEMWNSSSLISWLIVRSGLGRWDPVTAADAHLVGTRELIRLARGTGLPCVSSARTALTSRSGS
jgi:hypothetical protein